MVFKISISTLKRLLPLGIHRKVTLVTHFISHEGIGWELSSDMLFYLTFEDIFGQKVEQIRATQHCFYPFFYYKNVGINRIPNLSKDLKLDLDRSFLRHSPPFVFKKKRFPYPFLFFDEH
jgi:hypothetical protein